jgi:hypothetical protein
MDNLAQKLRAIEWDYADKDLDALGLLRQRIQDTGSRFGLISYSDLVKDIEFHYPNIDDGKTYRINAHGWTGLDRRIIGNCLAYLSMESYLEAGFMANALVIARLESKPSDIFFEWMESLGVLPDHNEDTVLAFWCEQVKKAHQWYAYKRRI